MCWDLGESTTLSFFPWLMVKEGESQSCRGWREDTPLHKGNTTKETEQNQGLTHLEAFEWHRPISSFAFELALGEAAQWDT